ncbi:MAG: metallophosphoesterase [Treponema sp.]|nr:metallophosphoesterase [Treponema sp.]
MEQVQRFPNEAEEKVKRLKRLVMGDVHGRDFWKRHLEKDFSEFYILGDYFDSFDVPFEFQLKNFLELCKAARTDSRIKLCLGNHDYHYLKNIFRQEYSGFQARKVPQIREALEENMDLIKVLYVIENRIIISHAGVSTTFMEQMKSHGVHKPEDINSSFLQDRNILTFSGRNNYGDDVTQSPIWIRPASLIKDHLAGYSQIVGHTEHAIIKVFTLEKASAEREALTLVICDTGDRDLVYRF